MVKLFLLMQAGAVIAAIIATLTVKMFVPMNGIVTALAGAVTTFAFCVATSLWFADLYVKTADEVLPR